MDSNRKTAIIVGVLFIIATASTLVSSVFIGSIYDPNYLTAVSANENQVILGALLEIIATAAIVGIPIAMYPILKKHNEGLALGYVGTRIFEGLIIFLNTIILLSILALSQEFVNTVTPDASYFQTSGTLLLAAREQISILVDFPFPIGAVIFSYLLYKTKLTPRWLAVLGLIGGVLWLATAPLRMFGFNPEPMEFMALPIAAQEMVLAIWLIVKGFNPAVIASKSPQVDS